MIILFGLLFLVRIFGLNLNFYSDETVFALEAKDGFKNFSKVVSEHPPLPIFLYSLFGEAFGNSNFAIRLVPFTFAMLSILLTYFLAKEIFDKKTALASAIVMAVSFWHTLATLQVDIDGSILTFMFLAAFFCYIKFEKTKERTWIFITGIFFGLSLLTKLPGILVFPILGLYALFSRKNFKDILWHFFVIGLIGTGVFFGGMGLSYLAGFNLFDSILEHTNGAVSLKISFLPLIYILIWGTPLLVFTPFLSFGKFKKEHILFAVWCIVPLFFYLFAGIPGLSPFDRYLMILIPALSILAGNYIGENFDTKCFKRLFFSGAVFFVLIFVLNINPDYVAHNLGSYVSNILNLKWNFYFPITGSSGAMFGMNFASIAIGYFIGGVLFLFLILNKFREYVLPVFLGLVFAFNIFMVQELAFHAANPDFNKAITDVSDYFVEHKLPYPIYTNQFSYLYYLNLESEYHTSLRQTDKFFWFSYDARDYSQNYFNFSDKFDNMIKSKEGTILLVDFPIMDKNSEFWKAINLCRNTKTFYSKGFPVGYVFEC